MAPSATSSSPPPLSALQETILTSKLPPASPHPPHLHHLALQALHNLQYERDWTSLTLHTHSPLTGLPLSRPLISGVPPKRLYVHPDEQIELLKHQHDTGEVVVGGGKPEREWVLPTQIQEKWSLRRMAEVFDAVGTVPPSEVEGEAEIDEDEEEEEEKEAGWQWRGSRRQKRLLLATVHDDSTIVFYLVHDGIVKPRQN